MITMKKLSIAITTAVLCAFCLGLEPAHAHPGNTHLTSIFSKERPEDILVVPPDASGREAYYATGSLYTFLLTGADTDGQFSLFDFLIPPEAGPPVHIHSREDESFYILDGNLTLQLGNQTVEATPGTFLYLPKGRPHNFKNLGTTPARTLSLITPSGFEGFFREQNQPVIDKSAPIPPEIPLEQLIPIAEKYGIQVVDPSQPDESVTREGLLDYLVVPPDANRPSFNAKGGLYTSLATDEETGGQFSLFNVLLPPKAGPKLLRRNTHAAESFYVLDGEVTFQIGDQTTVGTPGTLVYLPKGTSYAFQNLGTKPAKTLFLRIPTRVPERSSSLVGIVVFGASVGAGLVWNTNRKSRNKRTLRRTLTLSA